MTKPSAGTVGELVERLEPIWKDLQKLSGEMHNADRVMTARVLDKLSADVDDIKTKLEAALASQAPQPRDPKVGEAVERLRKILSLLNSDPVAVALRFHGIRIADIRLVLSALEGGEQPPFDEAAAVRFHGQGQEQVMREVADALGLPEMADIEAIINEIRRVRSLPVVKPAPQPPIGNLTGRMPTATELGADDVLDDMRYPAEQPKEPTK